MFIVCLLCERTAHVCKGQGGGALWKRRISCDGGVLCHTAPFPTPVHHIRYSRSTFHTNLPQSLTPSPHFILHSLSSTLPLAPHSSCVPALPLILTPYPSLLPLTPSPHSFPSPLTPHSSHPCSYQGGREADDIIKYINEKAGESRGNSISCEL